MRQYVRRLAVASSVLTIVFAGGASAENPHRSGTDLTGTWQIVATIPKEAPVCGAASDCVYPALATATRDGTVLQTAPISGTLTGHGVWKRVGPRNFALNTIYFRVNAATGAFEGTSETTIAVTVNRGGRTAAGTFTAVILGPDGQHITDYAGTVTAQRMEID